MLNRERKYVPTLAVPSFPPSILHLCNAAWECAIALVAMIAILTSPAFGQSSAKEPTLAATPPMGWNSWDSYGRTLNEETIKANAQWMAHYLKRFGWDEFVPVV